MNKHRFTPVVGRVAPDVAAPADGPVRAWVRFWFNPTDPIGLHVLRVLAGLLFLAWLLPFAGHDEFFSLRGWFDTTAYSDAADLPEGPPHPFSWSLLYLCGQNAVLLTTAYAFSVAILVLFTAGVWTRLTAVLTWVVVGSYAASPATRSEAEPLVLILAFYLMVGYVFLGLRTAGQPWRLRLLGESRLAGWFRRQGPTVDRPSVGANLALRLLQVHLAIAIVMTGLHKLQYGDWWVGIALWFPMHPPLESGPGSFHPLSYEGAVLLSLATYAILAWEIGFPLFAWKPSWRFLLIGGAAAGWVGSVFVYHLPWFGPALLIGSLSYVTAAEWRRLAGWLWLVPGLSGIAQRLTPVDEPAAPPLKKDLPASSVALGHR